MILVGRRISQVKRPTVRRNRLNSLQKQVPVADNPSQMPSILALDKLCNRSLSRKRKCYWFLVILFSVSITGWQVGNCFSRYLKMPISTMVTTEPLQIIRYPTVTICKDYNTFYSCVKDELEKRSLKNASISTDIWIKLWDYCGIQVGDVDCDIPCNIAVNVTECYYQQKHNINEIDKSISQTIFGQCIDLTSKHSFINDPNRFTRVYWLVTIYYDDHVMANYQDNKSLHYNLVLRESTNASTYNIFYQTENIFNKKETSVHFSKREYRYLHTRTNPCQTENERAKCNTNCLTNLLEQQLICKLPFLNSSKLQLCRTYHDYISTVTKVRDFFYSEELDSCNCLRACNFMEYQIVRTYSKLHDQIGLNLKIQDKINEIISQYYSYSFSSFVSDAAGNLGFFLGASLIGIMECIEAFAVKISQK